MRELSSVWRLLLPSIHLGSPSYEDPERGNETHQYNRPVTNVDEQVEGPGLAYPNPVTDVLNVLLPEHLGTARRVHIVDAAGRIVLDQVVKGKPTRLSLPVAQLSSGSYLVRAIGDRNVFTSTFIKY